MKILRNLLLATTALSAVSFANAVTYTEYTDTDLEGGAYEYLTSRDHGQSTWSSTFNLLEDGFNPAVFNIVSAIVEFTFADDSDWKSWHDEYFKIIVGGETLWDSLEVDGTINWNNLSDSSGYATYSMNLTDTQLVNLQDGVIDYSVQATWGDAYLKEAKIVAYGDTVNIPDSVTTGSLLAVVLFGVIAFRRSVRRA